MERDRNTRVNSGYQNTKKTSIRSGNPLEKDYADMKGKRDDKRDDKREGNQKLRCIAIAVVSGILTMLGGLCILSVVLTTGALPLGAISFLGVVVGCLGAFISGFVCSRMYKQNGFFFGMLCASILFAVLFLVSFAVVAKAPTMFALIKLLAMLICGAIGGSVGVNMKRRT